MLHIFIWFIYGYSLKKQLLCKRFNDCYNNMGIHFLHPTSINVMTDVLLHQCWASPPARKLCISSGAVCVAAATVLHIGVWKGNHISIPTVQVNSAIAGAWLPTAGARLLQSSRCIGVPEKRGQGWLIKTTSVQHLNILKFPHFNRFSNIQRKEKY